MSKVYIKAFYLNILVIFLVHCCMLTSVKNFSVKASIPAESTLRSEYNLDSNRTYKLPIIMYHSTFKAKPGNFNIPPIQLEKDFNWLNENGYHAVTVSDLILFKEKGVCLPEKPIMLTFDDGYTNNYLYMFPLLEKYNLRCVLSVVGVLTDQNYPEADNKSKPSLAHMDYEQIKLMSDSGMVEIQNHTYNMHHCDGARKGLMRRKDESPADYQKNLTDDLKKLDNKLLEHCGIKTTAVVYPFGAYSKETVPHLKKLGYKASLTCRAGINNVTRTSSLFNLKRYNRPYGKTSEQYFEGILNKPMNSYH